jgi:hypothetical protein
MKKINKNEYINDCNKYNTTDKYVYVRSGKCDYIKCQSACCRFNCQHNIKNTGHIKDYHKMCDYQHIKSVQTKVFNKYTFYLTPRLCPHIKIEGGCELHGKRTQPRVCKYFPMSVSDGMYQAVKHVCGYKFKKVKNLNYKKEKKK